MAPSDCRFIEPELREDRGELEAARARPPPACCSSARTCAATCTCTPTATATATTRSKRWLRRRASRASSYLAITDHSRRLAMAHGLDPVRLAKQIDAHRPRSTSDCGDSSVLKGIEVDILEDGKLDLPD